MKKRLRLILVFTLALAVVAGIVTAVCFLTDPVDKKPDDTTQQTDPDDATEPTNPGDVTNQTADSFLQGKISATDKDGRKLTIQDYIRGDYNKYALYDMSGDGVAELIIRTGNGLTVFSIKEQELTVWYEGTTYEKPLNNRAIFYERPGGAPEHTAYQYIVLDSNGEELQRTSFTESRGNNAEYIINGEKVSKTAYEDLCKSSDLSDDKLVWKDIPVVADETKTAAQAYTDFLNGYVTDTSVLYFTKDIDGNGTEELIVDQNTAMEVYTYQGTVKKVGAHDFITGTLLLHHTKDNKYPGIVYVTVGGGKNHFGYITITDGALSVRQTFDDDYGMVSGKKEDVFYTQDEDLIAVSQRAYQEESRIGYSVWEPKTTENPYAIREITDQRVSTVGVKKVFNNGQFTLNVPKSWKCLTASGEDNVVYYFQEPVLGEKCELRINVTFVDYYKERTQEEYLEALSKSRKSVVIDSFTKGSIQGFPCTKIVYSYTENNTEFVGIWYDNLIEGSRLYDFRITYPAAESKNYEKEFAAIIESVRFVANISSLPLEEAYDYALRHYMAGPSSRYRDVGKLQSETQQIVEISGKYYQSFVASNVDIRYIWISQSEFPDNKTALWDWYPVGSSQIYSMDLLGNIDEDRKGGETDKIGPDDMPLLAVLYNNQPFYSQSRQKNITISTYQKTISGFTVVDMDSDGKNELAVSLNDGNILLLRQADGIVHGYDFGHRGMNQIYKDGIFSWTEDAGNIYGYSTLRFADNGVQITELWQVKHDGSGGFTNYIDGKQVSEAQINAIKQQYNWEYVKWFGYGK